MMDKSEATKRILTSTKRKLQYSRWSSSQPISLVLFIQRFHKLLKNLLYLISPLLLTEGKRGQTTDVKHDAMKDI